MADGDAVSVSVVLLTLNGMPEFGVLLDSLAGQVYGGAVEYIHVDSGSTDGTVETALRHGITPETIPQRTFHHGRTRNHAAARARHDILVFITQDALPASGQWLRNLVAPFCDPRVAAVYGKQSAPGGMSALRRHSLESLYPDQREVRELSETNAGLGLYRFSNANSAVRASVWRQIPFPETAPICEDQGLCRDLLHAGYQVVYAPDAEVIHGHERTLWEEFQWAVDNGCSLKRLGILGRPGMGSETKYGLRKIRAEFIHFLRAGRPLIAAQTLVINAARWAGVQVGKRADVLPRRIAKRCSFWLARELRLEDAARRQP